MHNGWSLPVMQKIDGPNEYPWSRTKKFLFGHWYITVGPEVLMLPILVRISHPDPIQSMDFLGYRCQECKRRFIAYDENGLYHECMGVVD